MQKGYDVGEWSTTIEPVWCHTYSGHLYLLAMFSAGLKRKKGLSQPNGFVVIERDYHSFVDHLSFSPNLQSSGQSYDSFISVLDRVWSEFPQSFLPLSTPI